MKKINFRKYIIISIILLGELKLVNCGDPDPNERPESERLRLKRPASEEPGPSRSVQPSQPRTLTPIEVDINMEKSTDTVLYCKTRKFIMLTPKSGYIFGSLKEGRCEHCNLSDRIVWFARDQTELSKKIILPLIRVGSRVDNTVMKVIIYQENGKRRFISKRPRFTTIYNDQWVEKVYNVPVVEHPAEITIVTADDLNGTNPVANNTTQYSVSKNFIGNDLFEVVYSFPNSSNCMQVLFDGEVVWRFDTKYLAIWKVYYIPFLRMLMFSYNDENYYSHKIQINNT